MLKPSSTAKNSNKLMIEMINSNFSKEYAYAVSGSGSIVTGIMENPFDKVFFTGSPRVGKELMKLAANHLTDITLELGDKSPSVFTKEGLTDSSVKRLLWGKFFNGGVNLYCS